MDELEKLARTLLSQPKGIRKFIIQSHKELRQSPVQRLDGYVSTYQIWHNKLIKRTFAAKEANKKLLIQEVCRKMEGGKFSILCNIENRSMAGNIVNWTENGKWENKRISFADNGWYFGSKNSWNFETAAIMCDLDGYRKLMEELDIPYCAYDHPNFDNYRAYFDFLKYCEIYRKYPKIELLVKLGAPQLITGARYFNFKGKNFEKIFKISKYWQPYLGELSVKGILKIRKNSNINSIERYRFVEKHSREFNYYPKIEKYFNFKKMDYFRQRDFHWGIYNDYLNMAEKLGYPLSENKYLYPVNLREFHDKALKETQIKEDKSYDEGIKSNADKSRKYNYKDSKYIIRTVETSRELIEESINNDNCVRTYAERVAKGQTHIFFLRTTEHSNDSLVTVELKNNRVTQAFAYHNSKIDDECRKFLIKWCKKFKFNSQLLEA